jgi:hypothetical protein
MKEKIFILELNCINKINIALLRASVPLLAFANSTEAFKARQ